jgi:hypothetical protein
MGRPLSKKFIGNIQGTGQQIVATAYIPDSNGPTTAWIQRQVATNTYNMANVAGVELGRCQLVQGGVALQPGEANIKVTPYGASGSGASAVAHLGIQSATVISGGNGDTTHYYVPGEIVYSSSGSFSPRGNLVVETVQLGSASVVGNGNGYTVGDKFIWNYANYESPVVLTVASTTANGNVNGVTYSSVGSVSNINLSNTTPYSSATLANSWAHGATFSIRWDVQSLNVVNPGDYTTAPSGTLTLSGSTHGQNASTTLSWLISSVAVTNGGANYDAPAVIFSSGTAAASAVTNAAGGVTSVVVTDPGGPYTNTPPSVSISPSDTIQYAQEIRDRTVTTWDKNTYEWLLPDEDLTASNQARIETA